MYFNIINSDRTAIIITLTINNATTCIYIYKKAKKDFETAATTADIVKHIYGGAPAGP